MSAWRLGLRRHVHLCRPFSNADVAGLLSAGADPNVLDYEGCSVLSFAVKYGGVERFNMLVAAGADVMHKDKFGRSLMNNAIERADDKIIERLLSLQSSTVEYYTCSQCWARGWHLCC